MNSYDTSLYPTIPPNAPSIRKSNKMTITTGKEKGDKLPDESGGAILKTKPITEKPGKKGDDIKALKSLLASL